MSLNLETMNGGMNAGQHTFLRTRLHDEAESWLNRNIERARIERATIKSVNVTPALADVMLARNHPANRKLRPMTVRRFVQMIEDGDFATTHQGIGFATDGLLFDGQHRLSAILKSGIAVYCDVSFGEKRENFDRVDAMPSRTLVEMLHISGVQKNNTALVPMVRTLLAIDANYSTDKNVRLTPHLLLQFLEEHPDLHESAAIVASIKTTLKRLPSPGGMGAGIFLIRERMGRHEGQPFFDSLKTGAGFTSDTDPGCRLRNRCLAIGPVNALEMAAITIKAFNAWHEGRAVRQLRWRPVENFPVPGEGGPEFDRK